MIWIMFLLLTVTVKAVAVVTGAQRWAHLSHYLMGAVEVQDVSRFFTREIKKQLMRVSCLDASRTVQWRSSVLYESSGFHSRPELFYLIGGFTSRWDWLEDGSGIVFYGEDVYDWHPADKEGNWFGSPLPLEKSMLLRGIFTVANKFWPQYFVSSTWPCNSGPGVSNRLWADVPWAKDFTSKWRWSLTWAEIDSLYPEFSTAISAVENKLFTEATRVNRYSSNVWSYVDQE